jgi:hypothetical protein
MRQNKMNAIVAVANIAYISGENGCQYCRSVNMNGK